MTLFISHRELLKKLRTIKQKRLSNREIFLEIKKLKSNSNKTQRHENAMWNCYQRLENLGISVESKHLQNFPNVYPEIWKVQGLELKRV